MDRREFLRTLFDARGHGLEIGPSYNPILRKSDGYRIDVADWAHAERLRQIYPRADIEHVDYVTDGGSLADVIEKRRCYDFIRASHVIEHIPDIVKFLADCSILLKDSGVLVLAVPDKRHCFDIFQGMSSTGDVLRANFERRTRHSPARVFDQFAYAAKRGENVSWDIGYAAPLCPAASFDDAYPAFINATESPDYVDTHGWYFSPSSFRLIVHDLYCLGKIDLREHVFSASVGSEFYMVLSRSGDGYLMGRQALLTNVLVEMRAVPEMRPDASGVVPSPPNLPNIALGKRATQSSISRWSNGYDKSDDAAGAVNGRITGSYQFHTAEEDEPWWRVDLGGTYALTEIRLFNRIEDPGYRYRLGHFSVQSSLDATHWQTVHEGEGRFVGGADGDPLILCLGNTVVGRFVRIIVLQRTMLHLDQVEVYGIEHKDHLITRPVAKYEPTAKPEPVQEQRVPTATLEDVISLLSKQSG